MAAVFETVLIFFRFLPEEWLQHPVLYGSFPADDRKPWEKNV
jgi:hypothetical protein